MSTFTLETVIQVWNDQHGERVEVGPDHDGLNLVEVRSVDSNGKTQTSITMEPEQATLVAQAILKLCGPPPQTGG